MNVWVLQKWDDATGFKPDLNHLYEDEMMALRAANEENLNGEKWAAVVKAETVVTIEEAKVGTKRILDG